ncbi:hypothetical protein, partial [Helicobacter sp. 12S02634-8]|uniref:beta strand repeat-containing protein n=1 Tax=Helicobacter sp. 12S02634-8 TaxID=1476199 RepID=UPI00117A9F09
MFPFSGDVAQAAKFGDDTCVLGGATSCINLNTSSNVTLSYTKGSNTANIAFNSSGLGTSSINANAMVIFANPQSSNGGVYTVNMKNSVWVGDFTNYGAEWNVRRGVSTFNFDGNYNGAGSSNDQYKGYAFVGTMNFAGTQQSTFTFTNGAKMKGDWNVRQAEYPGWAKIVFKGGSSLVGKDQTSNGQTTQKNSQITVRDPGFDLTLADKSTAKADIVSMESEYGRVAKTSITLVGSSTFSGSVKNQSTLSITAVNSFFNGTVYSARGKYGGADYGITPIATLFFKNSSFTGDIKTEYANYASWNQSTTATFYGNGTGSDSNSTEGYALKGNIDNQAGLMDITFKGGAVWDGKFSAVRKNSDGFVRTTLNFDNATQKESSNGSNTITNNTTLLTINAKNNSKVQAVTLNGNTNNINFDTNSTLKSLTISGGTNAVTFKGGANITGDLTASNGTNTINFSDTSKVGGNINLSNGTSTLNINAKNTEFKDIKATGTTTTLLATFDTTSVGAIQAMNAASSVNFKNMAGLSIGKISGNGGDTTSSGYAGTLTGVLDFVPAKVSGSTAEAKSLSISDIIIKDNNNNVHLTLNFGGADSNGKLKGKNSNTSLTNIKGGGTNSSVIFSDVGSFDFSKTSNNGGSDNGDGTTNGYKGQMLDVALKSATNIDVSSFTGALGLEKTSIILDTNSALAKSVTPSGSNDSSDSSDSSQAQTGILSDSTKNLSITFGNATIQKDSMGNIVYDTLGRPTIIANEGDKSFTLTQSGATHTKKENTNDNGTTNGVTEYTDGYVSGISSDGNIGFDNDNFKKTIAFVYKDGTFKSGQSGYTGTILGGTA